MAHRWPSSASLVSLLVFWTRRVHDRERVMHSGSSRHGHGRNGIKRLRRYLLQPCGSRLCLLWVLAHVLHRKDSVWLRL